MTGFWMRTSVTELERTGRTRACWRILRAGFSLHGTMADGHTALADVYVLLWSSDRTAVVYESTPVSSR